MSLIHIGNEYGNLMSMACRHDKIGRMLFRTNCDPFVMLSHALGTKAKQNEESKTMPQRVHSVGEYLNENVHSLSKELIEARKKDHVSVCMFDLDSFVGMIDPNPDVVPHNPHVRSSSGW